MTHAYSDPTRETDPHALPNIEIFHSVDCDFEETLEPGYYWQFCFPGCLPDGDVNGPFETEEEALRDAQNNGENS